MQKCIVISDSFKGTLSSREICDIARNTIPCCFPSCEVITIPIADGGEGTVDCFIEAIKAKTVSAEITGPFGEPISALYAVKDDLAIIEMSSAAGLPMVGDKKDPSNTTTFGVGQLISHAIKSGCRRILLGIGGSATNDGGCGCAAALGVKFFDHKGKEFIPVGKNLDQIHKIDISAAKELLKDIRITAMCDVDNPMHGPTGAAYTFAPQKGADSHMVQLLDYRLRSLDEVIKKELGLSVADIPGTGAAGGLGAGCIAFLDAELCPGIELILDVVDFDKLLEGADMVITGEGRIDGQSLHGKVISGIAKRTSKMNIPLVAIVGSIDENSVAAYDIGVTALFSINRKSLALKDSAPFSAINYKRTLEDILRLIKAVK